VKVEYGIFALNVGLTKKQNGTGFFYQKGGVNMRKSSLLAILLCVGILL
jgi:hypothetical protein